MALAIGTQVNHYRITSSLGAGGMGEVYAVEDLKLGRDLALKLLPVEFTGESDRLRRFNQEARAASALNHPNIITIYEIGQSEAGHYIVMDLVVGTTLREMIGQPGLTEKFSSMARQIAQALRVAHDAGITHRDIKPENIMVRSDGYVKLLDFGLARLASSKAARTETQTLSITADGTVFGTILGTIRYMSPEQARGETLTNATDIFSLGIVLYEFATGRHPFETNSAIGVLQAIVSDSPLPPSRLNPELSAGVEAMLLSMLEKDQRFRPSAVELEEELAQPGGPLANVEHSGTHIGKTRFQTVGREREQAQLKAGFDAIRRGRGLMLCISGEPGTGKTTLIEDFLSELASSPGSHIGRGRCSERLAGTEAYLPWLEALDTLLHDHRSREFTAGIMKSIAPTWYGQVAAQASDDSSVSRLKSG